MSIKKLKAHDEQLCIYGQITGDCNSERSINLLNKCAKPYSALLYEYRPVEAIKFTSTGDTAFSALEYYICQEGAKSNLVIKYLKGEID